MFLIAAVSLNCIRLRTCPTLSVLLSYSDVDTTLIIVSRAIPSCTWASLRSKKSLRIMLLKDEPDVLRVNVERRKSCAVV